jgi:hypothetical protein
VALAVALPYGRASGDVHQDRRTEAGLKIFRALLAADLDIEKKAVEGKLVVLFFYTDDARRADELGRGSGEPIRGLPVAVESTKDAAFGSYDRRVPAGIFVAQPPDAETLKALVRYGITHHVIVYSPFEGHVESGVLGGLVVEAQVRPYINQATLTASSISLKEFFLKVTKVWK